MSLCACGCGCEVGPAKRDGKPHPYLRGHNNRGRGTNYRVVRPLAVRFWSKVQKQEGDGCWLWTGGADVAGYGLVRLDDKRMTVAHRAAWALEHGPIPAGLCALHRCDTPRCVRPSHLFLGTRLDNVRDMVSKGRQRSVPGERHPFASLTESDVRYIRAAYNPSGPLGSVTRTRELLADRFGVSPVLITKIQLGTAWRHLDRGAA